LVLEVLKNEKPLSAVASTHNITPKNLQNWKNTFLDNAETEFIKKSGIVFA